MKSLLLLLFVSCIVNSVLAQDANLPSQSNALVEKYNSYVVLSGVCQVRGRTPDGTHTLTVCTQAVYDSTAKDPAVEYIQKPLLRKTENMKEVLAQLESHNVQLQVQNTVPEFRLITPTEFFNFMLSLENPEYTLNPGQMELKLKTAPERDQFVQGLLDSVQKTIHATEADIALFDQSICDYQVYRTFVDRISLDPQDPQTVSKAWGIFVVIQGLSQETKEVSGRELKSSVEPLRRLKTTEERLFFMRELIGVCGDPYFRLEGDPISNDQLQIRMLNLLRADHKRFFESLQKQWS